MLAPQDPASAHRSASDDELVTLARAGSSEAYGELWRRHSGIGISIARRYYEIADADDLVSESFARILSTLQRGGGPHSGFRPYLITTIGNVARRWATQSREGASDQLDYLEDPKTVDDPVVASNDRELALEAFRSLPDRWQAVLWYSTVEGLGPTEVAGFLGMTPNAVSVLAHRARAGLRTAWVQAHLDDSTLAADCRWASKRLARRAAGTLSARETKRVEQHLSACIPCSDRAKELDQLGLKLAGILVPALLGLGLTRLDSNDPVAAMAALPEATVPMLSGAHAWLAGAAVVVVAAAAILTSSTPPATGDPTDIPISPPVAAERVRADHQPQPSIVEVEPEAPVIQAPEPPPPAPVDPPRPAPTVDSPPPSAPVVSTAIDPDALRPPTLAGTAASNAVIVITDDLGNEIARVTADEDGAWETPELSGLSPVASSLVVRQVLATGETSPATTLGPLAFRPRIYEPDTDPYETEGSFGVSVGGWSGATVEVTFEAVEVYGRTATATYSGSQLVLRPYESVEGIAWLYIDASEEWYHRVTLRYVDGERTSAGQTSLVFGVRTSPR